jgi:hypothetical protein
MSIVTRPKRLSEALVPSSAPEPAPTAPPTTLLSGRVRAAEAPERAALPSEAPESRRGRWAEAPDAGEGRGSYLEHEFTHGRSQS